MAKQKESVDMDLPSKILALDKYQASEAGIKCLKEPEKHGKLGVHGSGSWLLCCMCEQPVALTTAGILDAPEDTNAT